MKTIIGLYSSCAQSGKSTVANTLYSDYGFDIVKFAGPLKDMTRGLLRSMGIQPSRIERMVEGDLKEEVIPGFATVTPRRIMQTLGTDWGREAVACDLWTQVGIAKVNSLDDDVVVDDLRFPNEYAELRKLGAFMVRVVRPGISGPAAGSSRYEGLLDNHEFDYVLVNDGTLEDLRSRVRNMRDLATLHGLHAARQQIADGLSGH